MWGGKKKKKKVFIKKQNKKTFPLKLLKCILIRPSTCLSEEVGEILCTVDFTDSFPTTSFWSFHHYRVANFLSSLEWIQIKMQENRAYWRTVKPKPDNVLTLRPSSTPWMQPSSYTSVGTLMILFFWLASDHSTVSPEKKKKKITQSGWIQSTQVQNKKWRSPYSVLPVPLHGRVGMPAVWATIDEAILSPRAHIAWLGGPEQFVIKNK